MGLPRVVLDNSAVLPAYFPEPPNDKFDAGLVNNRARSLVHAVRTRQVNAYVPPSFFREFLHVSSRPLDVPGGRTAGAVEQIRAQWDDLLSLPLMVVPVKEILHHSGVLTLDEGCPATDSWYLAAAVHTESVLWMSHEHRDNFISVADRHVRVRLLSRHAFGS